MNSYNILILQEDKYFVAKNLELGVVSQGESLCEALTNIKEATELYLDDSPPQVSQKLPSFFTTITV